MQKYNWKLDTFLSIHWQSHDKSIKDSRYLQKRFIKRFIRHRLPVGKMNFPSEHICPFCDKPQQQNTAHDHFIQCNHLRLEKRKWIQTLRAVLSKVFTPPNLREAILDRVYNYYESNLSDTGRVAFEESHSYDSRSGSEESIAPRRGQRRIIEPDDDKNTEDESSNSNRSEDSLLTHTRRKLISGTEANSIESDEVCFEFASNGSKESTTSRLIEPFHQDFNEKSDQILLEPLLQDLSLQKKRDTSPSSTSLQMRGDPASIASKEYHSPLHQARKLISGTEANSME